MRRNAAHNEPNPSDTLGARELTAAPPLWVELAVVLCFAGLILWAAPDLRLWLASLRAAPVQTSARLSCHFPSEHETLLVYVNTAGDGSIFVSCGPLVGARGAYPGVR